MATPTPTRTPTKSLSGTKTPTPTITPSSTASHTPTPTVTNTPPETPSVTPSPPVDVSELVKKILEGIPSKTPEPTSTPTPSRPPTATPTPTRPFKPVISIIPDAPEFSNIISDSLSNNKINISPTPTPTPLSKLKITNSITPLFIKSSDNSKFFSLAGTRPNLSFLNLVNNQKDISIIYKFKRVNNALIPIFKFDIEKTDSRPRSCPELGQWYILKNPLEGFLLIENFTNDLLTQSKLYCKIKFAFTDNSYFNDKKNPKLYFESLNYSFVINNNVPVVTPTSSIIQSVTPTPIFLQPTTTKSPRPSATVKPQIILPTPTPTPIKEEVSFTPTIICSTSLSTKKEYICPVIDTQRLSYTLIHNLINELVNPGEIASELSPKGGFAKARYITKPVRLVADSAASRLFISFAANVPKQTFIRLYYRVFNTVEDPDSNIETKPWVLVGNSGDRKTYDVTKFIDFEFEVEEILYEGNSSLKEFDMFSIKIVMESELDSIVPKIKDFRVIALS